MLYKQNKRKAQLNFKIYTKELGMVLSKIQASDSYNKEINFNKIIETIIKEISCKKHKKGKVIIIGNGGSASIASHISTDFLKNAKVPAIAFNDSSLLTCISNDLGYENVFKKPIEMLANKDDILISISSSGKSKNILDATRKAKEKGCFVVTLSGFDKNNPLRRLGDINFYVSSDSYGYVEIVHLAICHFIVDTIITDK